MLQSMNAYRADEPDEQQCPCPFCGIAGPETDMDCIHCQNIIPFCIATGECKGCAPRVSCNACESVVAASIMPNAATMYIMSVRLAACVSQICAQLHGISP